MSDWARVEAELEKGAREQVAPAIVLLAWKRGSQAALMAAGNAAEDTVFDLASLTKPLATALLALDLEAQGLLSPETELGLILGPALDRAKQGISLYRLFTHSSGLPAHRPYHTLLEKNPPMVRKGLLKAVLANEPLEYAPGEKAVYSDLGYMLLGLLLEEALGCGLDQALAKLYQKWGVDGPGFAPVDKPPPWPLERIAPCGPLPGRDVVHGRVEDENAFALGGVAGHAGLFGTARQVAGVMDMLCKGGGAGGVLPPELAGRLWRVDKSTPGSTRTWGFDTPSPEKSAAGGNRPPGLVGHLGFTGVSLWWQPAENTGLALLTNRVALGRENWKIREFRRSIHTLAWRVLGY